MIRFARTRTAATTARPLRGANPEAEAPGAAAPAGGGRNAPRTGLSAGRLRVSEVAGAFGDIGTLIPILIALVMMNGLPAGNALFGVGIVYIASGLYFRLPIPVQPLKAAAAIVLALGLPARLLTASALVLAPILLLLSATGLADRLTRIFPKCVVRGIQLAVGLMLLRAAAKLILDSPAPRVGEFPQAAAYSTMWPLAIFATAALLLILLQRRQQPASLALLGLGLMIGLPGTVAGVASVPEGGRLLSLALPTWADLKTACWLLAIPQLPLTLGNAVVATTDAARTYFGAGAKRVTPRALALSMGLSNLFAGLIGGLPVCHGSGGLTAHYRFGARTGASGLIIGSLCVLGAVVFGGSASAGLRAISPVVLGVMLCYVGLQHALLARDLRRASEVSIAALVVVVTLACGGNIAAGFVAALMAFWGGCALRHWRHRAGRTAAGNAG